ncbi:Flp pilus assembly pilin Flp [Aurantimicrobium minutum]|nr:Flp pilus assembly pilin Flp [Aurantimicrobium minutum]
MHSFCAVMGAKGVVNMTTHKLNKLNKLIQTLKHFRSEAGAATAEYAIATMAAVGFAGLLVTILRGDEVKQILTDMVRRALTFGG